MMMACKTCESPQFLQIVRSRIRFRNGSSVSEIKERYECTLCGSTGEYRYKDHGDTGHVIIEGDVLETDDRPVVSP